MKALHQRDLNFSPTHTCNYLCLPVVGRDPKDFLTIDQKMRAFFLFNQAAEASLVSSRHEPSLEPIVVASVSKAQVFDDILSNCHDRMGFNKLLAVTM